MPTCDDSVDDTRLYKPCPSLTEVLSTAELVKACECCGKFCTACCFHKKIVCHHRFVVFTDGACTNNGKAGAVSGLGIAFGTIQAPGGDDSEEDLGCQQFSIPVDDRIDPRGARTNQRAELLAALHGLRKLCDYQESELADEAANRRKYRLRESEQPEIIITTDSEYVVKGMTEWMPNWKKNNLRKSTGQRPMNIDLFCRLDEEVNKRERQHDIKIKFWHVYRKYNTIADGLAKRGALLASLSGDGHGDVEGTIRSFSDLAL